MGEKRIKKDLTGQRFGRLVALKEVGLNNQGTYNWLCKCDCGNDKIVRGSLLSYGNNRSCGCLLAESTAKRVTTHGGSGTSEYCVWENMIARCNNNKSTHYKNYGGRGIKICEEWLRFDNFIKDMGNRPSMQHTIDRFPNNNGNYEPNNCRWATLAEQSRNKRSNRWIEYDGKNMILQDWATYIGIPHQYLRYHLHNKTIGETILFFKNKN